MIKFVTSSEWLLRFASRHGFLRRILKGDMSRLSSYRDHRVLDMVYSSIGLCNGVSKQTEHGRFADIDVYAAGLIEDMGLKQIHDVGVSSGITSMELYEAVKNFGVSFHISDRYAKYRCVSRAGLKLILDADDRLLSVYAGPFFADHRCGRFFVLSNLLMQKAESVDVRSDEGESFLLFDKCVLNALAAGDMQYIEYDILRGGISGRFDYVRCMNLLNISYFPEVKLQGAICNVFDSIREGGVFQVGRTRSDGRNEVSFFIKQDGRPRLLHSINNGSEVESMVIAIGVAGSSVASK